MEFQGHRAIGRLDGGGDESWRALRCAHCDRDVSGAVVAQFKLGPSVAIRWIQCSVCGHGSVEDLNTVYPGAKYGPALQGLPPNVEAAYEEVRRCMQANAFTASEGLCRKILMHVAVDKGAKEGEKFVAYIAYLENQGYITPPMKGWVDLIRKHGNEAQHEIASPGRQRAESTVMFTAQLLRTVYEMEHLAKAFQPTTPPAPAVKKGKAR